MCSDAYEIKKEQLKIKKDATDKEHELRIMKNLEFEGEINDKFLFFSKKISKIITSNIKLLEEYMKSDEIQNLKNSDKIKKEMKKYIINLENDKLIKLSNNMNNFKFFEDLDDLIKFEAKNSRNSFLDNFKNSKRSKILKIIGDMKEKFEEAFYPQKFHIENFDREIEKKMLDLKFEKTEKEEIDTLVLNMLKLKFQELIKKELDSSL